MFAIFEAGACYPTPACTQLKGNYLYQSYQLAPPPPSLLPSLLPSLSPSQWFTDYLSDLCEDEHLQRYLDIRIFLTNIDSPPDELASALLQLGLKTAEKSCNVRRPSQPQLNNLYHMTSYGVPDFGSLIDCKCVLT